MKKSILLFISIIILYPVVCWGQTTVFSDDFNRASVSPGGTPSMTYTSTLGTNVTASTISSSYLSIISGTSNAISYVSGPVSTFSAPYKSTLSSNTGTVTWTFNFRWNRASTNNPAAPASGAYGQAIILASSSATFTSGSTGYAIVYGNSATPDPIRLVRFSNGVATLTNICSSGASDIASTNNYASVRVTYEPSTNTWALFVRDDGSSAWSDPSTGVTSQKGSNTVDNNYTSTALTHFGFLYSNAATSGQSGDFDNFKVTIGSGATPTITVGSLSGFGNQTINTTSTEQSYSVSGSNLTADISITPPSGFEISTGTGGSFVATNPITLTQSGGTVSSTTIYVRFAPTIVQSYSGNIVHSSTGATDQNVAVTGTGINPARYYRSKTSGNWSDNTTWEISSDNSSWSDAPSTYTPSSNDNAIAILSGNTITVAADVTVDEVTINSGGQISIASGKTLTIANGTGDDLIIDGTLLNTGTLTINSGATWKLNTGATYIHNSTSSSSTLLGTSVTIASGSTWIYRGSSSLSTSVSVSNRTFGNLTFESESGAWSVTSSSGTSALTISGYLSIGGTGAGTVSYSTVGFTGAINVTGAVNIVNGNTLTTGASQFTFGSWNNNGTFNITLNNASGLTLAQSVTVNGTLTLTSGNISTSSNTLTIASGGSVSRTSGHIIGSLKKSSVTGSQIFDVGTSNGYTPVSMTITGTGDFTVQTVSGKHPNAVGSNVLGMYWTLTNGGITSADLQFTYLASDVTGTESNYSIGKYSSGTWSFPSTSLNTGTHTASTSGISSFSDFTLGENSALPVELTSFTSNVNGNKVELNWKTATEVNNYGFEIERRQTGNVKSETWEKIGFVQGNGNSNSPKSYSFTDEPTGGKEFNYRLKQIDNDGTYEYSDIVTATLENVSTFVLEQNFPNPFNPTTKISYTIPEKANVRLKVYDMIAQQVAELVNGSQEAGHYQVTFDGSNLPSGVYFYKLEAGNFVEVKKFMLVK